MNAQLYNLAASLLPEVTTVRVTHADSDKEYVYLCPRYIAESLEKGTLVWCSAGFPCMTMSSQGFSLGTVVSVDAETELDFESRYRYRWVHCIVPKTQDTQIESKIQQIMMRLAERKKQSRREQALLALGVNSVDELLALPEKNDG